MTGAIVVGDGVGAEPSLISTKQLPNDVVNDGKGRIATPIAALGALVLAAASAGIGRASFRRRRARA